MLLRRVSREVTRAVGFVGVCSSGERLGLKTQVVSRLEMGVTRRCGCGCRVKAERVCGQRRRNPQSTPERRPGVEEENPEREYHGSRRGGSRKEG